MGGQNPLLREPEPLGIQQPELLDQLGMQPAVEFPQLRQLPRQLAEDRAQVQVLQRLAGPANVDDVASAVLYFAGKGAGHNTGSMLVVDGGFMWT